MSGRKNWPKENFPKIKERYKRVKAMLKFQVTHKWFDDDCLKYVITELVESGVVYISKSVSEMKSFPIDGKQVKDFENGLSDRKITENDLKGRREKGITWEHVIPIKVLMETIKNDFNTKKLNFNRFQKIVSVAHICIVTSDENGRLIKEKMPNNCKDPIADPWARYKDKEAGINIYSLDI